MKTQLPLKLNSVFEVAHLIKTLGENQELFHPDDDATDIIDYETRKRVFTNKEAKLLDKLWGQAMEFCDVYELCIKWMQANGDEFFANYYEKDEPTFNEIYELAKQGNEK